MYILGIAGMGTDDMKGHLAAIGHDPSAALIKDGRLIAAAEEERFVRVKHAQGFFPYNAIKFCLEKEGIDITEVDHIVNNFDTNLDFKNQFFSRNLYFNPIRVLKQGIWDRMMYQSYSNNITRLAHFLKKQAKDVPSLIKKFRMIEHHLAHIGNSYYFSGFKDAALITLDAAGENISTICASGRNHNITKLKETYNPDSLGALYALFTEFLGFMPNDGEFKVMGLAAYGSPKMDISDLIEVSNGTFKIDRRVWGTLQLYSKYITDRFGKPKQNTENYTKRDANLAYAIQNLLEETVTKLVEYTVRQTNVDKLCLSGGVALNCKMNGRLLRSGIVSDLFIPPAPADNGTSIGAAMYHYVSLGYKPKQRLEHSYFGPEFSNADILKTLKKLGINKYEYVADISGEAARIIYKGGVLGWFQGRMEFGPRALGNRSILADPRNPHMKDIINETIKFREMFRPFCPSLLKEAADEYLEEAHFSPFMILTFQVPKKKQKEIQAVVHVDGTTRPQTVDKKVNKKFYNLIKIFESYSGVPVVLNTSFNIRGEPIVCTPQDALRTFYTCGMTHLALGNYLIKK